MSHGIFLVEETGRLVSANAFGRHLLREGLTVSNGRLDTVDAAGRVALRSAVKAVFEPPNERSDLPVLVPRHGQQSPYIVHTFALAQVAENCETGNALASPERAARDNSVVAMPRTAMIVVIDSKRAVRVRPEVLVTHLRLSPGEARIAAEIAGGNTPRESAKALGLTEDSLRVMLKRIYAKLNVSGKVELVLLVTRYSTMAQRNTPE